MRPGTNGLFYVGGIVFNRDANSPSAVFLARYIDNNNNPGGDSIAYLGTTVVDAGNKNKFIDHPGMVVDVPRPDSGMCTIRQPGLPPQTIPAGIVYMSYVVFEGTTAKPSESSTTISRTSAAMP